MILSSFTLIAGIDSVAVGMIGDAVTETSSVGVFSWLEGVVFTRIGVDPESGVSRFGPVRLQAPSSKIVMIVNT